MCQCMCMGHPCEGVGVNFQIFEILSLIGSAGGSIALIARPLAGPVGQAKDQCKKSASPITAQITPLYQFANGFPLFAKKRRSLFQRCTVRIMRGVEAIEESTE